MRHRQYKQCPTCGSTDRKAFGKNKARRDKLQTHCRACRKKLRGNPALSAIERGRKLTNESISVSEFLATRGRE